MMEVKYIPKEEYLEMLEKLKGNIRGQSLNLDPMVYSAEERKRLNAKQFNPDVPMQIEMHTTEGIIVYRIARQEKFD